VEVTLKILGKLPVKINKFCGFKALTINKIPKSKEIVAKQFRQCRSRETVPNMGTAEDIFQPADHACGSGSTFI
jgi:hypothetical protein